MPDLRALEGYSFAGRRGLEIGPLCTPRIVKADAQVYYLDHCSTEDLKKKYAGDPNISIDRIVQVDLIADGRPLTAILGNKAPLDFVVASHVIEHVPNLIGWLKEAEDALVVDGVLALWIPDKRFTFDLLRRVTATEDIAAAHRERRRRPSLNCIVDHFANVVSVECQQLWENYNVARSATLAHSPGVWKSAAAQHEQGAYVDCHCWVFTPWSFLSLMGWITSEWGLAFELDHFEVTPLGDMQFMVRLRKSRSETSRTDWKGLAATVNANAPQPSFYEVVSTDLGIDR